MKNLIHKWFNIHFWSDYTWVNYRRCTVCGLSQHFTYKDIVCREYDSAYRPISIVREEWYWETDSD